MLESSVRQAQISVLGGGGLGPVSVVCAAVLLHLVLSQFFSQEAQLRVHLVEQLGQAHLR